MAKRDIKPNWEDLGWAWGKRSVAEPLVSRVIPCDLPGYRTPTLVITVSATISAIDATGEEEPRLARPRLDVGTSEVEEQPPHHHLSSLACKYPLHSQAVVSSTTRSPPLRSANVIRYTVRDLSPTLSSSRR